MSLLSELLNFMLFPGEYTWKTPQSESPIHNLPERRLRDKLPYLLSLLLCLTIIGCILKLIIPDIQIPLILFSGLSAMTICYCIPPHLVTLIWIGLFGSLFATIGLILFQDRLGSSCAFILLEWYLLNLRRPIYDAFKIPKLKQDLERSVMSLKNKETGQENSINEVELFLKCSQDLFERRMLYLVLLSVECFCFIFIFCLYTTL